MSDWTRRLQATRTADVVVAGDGAAAVAAALAARASGREVLLLAPGPAVLSEVTVALDGEVGAAGSALLEVLSARVAAVGGLHAGWLDPPLAEMAADRLLAEAGVELLLYTTPVRLTTADGRADGVVVAGKHGFELIAARAVVDATLDGGLWAASGVEFSPPATVTASRTAYLQFCAGLPQLPARVGETALTARATWPGEVRLTLTATSPADGLPVPDALQRQLRLALADVLAVARHEPELAAAALSHTGHACLPHAVRQAAADGPVHPSLPNVFGAGAWLGGGNPRDLGAAATAGETAGRAAASGAVAAAGPLPTLATTVLAADALATDVVVAGGGTGGAIAALAAGQLAADTVLLESGGFLGGIGTGGGIHMYYHGVKGGVQDGIDERVRELAELCGGPARFVGFCPEAKKIALEEAVAAAGVRVGYGWTVADVLRDGPRVTGVVAVAPGRLQVWHAKAVVDGTGDGDVAALAGAPFAHGRASDGVCHAYSQSCGRFEGNKVAFTNFDAGYVDATDPVDLTRARRFGIQVYWRDEPRPEAERILYMAPLLGLRQSRHVAADYVVTLRDQARGESFDDVVAYGACHYDNHAFDYENESDEALFWCWVLGHWRKMMRHGVPYRSLLPRDVEGLVVGSRALGVTHDAHMLFRMQRDMQRIGEAAGTAAALAALAGTTPRALGPGPVQQRLTATGALLPDWASALPVESPEVLVSRLGGEQAAEAAWQLYLHGAAAVPPLQSALAAGQGDSAWWCATTLAMLDQPDGAPTLRSALAARDLTSPTNGSDAHQVERAAPRWKCAVALLGKIRDPAAVPLLTGVLADPQGDADGLIAAVRALGRIGGSEATESLLAFAELLSDGANLPTAALQQSMGPGTRLVRDVAWQVRAAVADVLAELGQPQPQLVEAYAEDERGWVRQHAAELLDQSTRLVGEAARVKATVKSGG